MEKKHTKIIYVQDAQITLQKCTVAKKEAHCPPFLITIFDYAICVDT